MTRQRRLPGMPGAPHSAQAQSQRAHVGAEAEAHFDRLNEVCARAGLAWVSRVSSHCKILRSLGRGRFEVALTGASVVDAMGWTRDGRAVAIEVKHVQVERLKDGSEAAWRLPLARIEEHQRTMLTRCAASGGLALLVVLHAGRVYAVPWPTVAEAITRGAASLGRDDLAPHLCDHREPYLTRFVHGADPSADGGKVRP